MFYFYTVLFFIVGLIIGSFLNVLIFRIDNLNSVWRGRSQCMKCKHQLAWYDLIPLFSFISLKGKCRYCKEKLSIQYPLVEFVTALIFLFLFLFYGLAWSFIFYALIFSILIVVVVVDIKTQTVPENFVWAALILSLLFGWYFGGFSFLNLILGGLVSGGLLALMVLISHEKWMGSGDIKIGLILGFLCGYPVAIFGMFFSFLIGAIVGLIYIKISRKTLKDALPFAPFLVFATLIALVYGNLAISWYLGAYF